jgi:hypothetical protein
MRYPTRPKSIDFIPSRGGHFPQHQRGQQSFAQTGHFSKSAFSPSQKLRTWEEPKSRKKIMETFVLKKLGEDAYVWGQQAPKEKKKCEEEKHYGTYRIYGYINKTSVDLESGKLMIDIVDGALNLFPAVLLQIKETYFLVNAETGETRRETVWAPGVTQNPRIGSPVTPGDYARPWTMKEISEAWRDTEKHAPPSTHRMYPVTYGVNLQLTGDLSEGDLKRLKSAEAENKRVAISFLTVWICGKEFKQVLIKPDSVIHEDELKANSRIF